MQAHEIVRDELRPRTYLTKDTDLSIEKVDLPMRHESLPIERRTRVTDGPFTDGVVGNRDFGEVAEALTPEMGAPRAIQFGQIAIFLFEPILKVFSTLFAVTIGAAQFIVDLPTDD